MLFSGISAKGVPHADEGSSTLSDPYATFEVVCEGDEDASAYGDGRTEALLGKEDPVWEDPVQLILPAGSNAALGRQGRPRVRVSVYDKDREDADELLGTTELTLTDYTGHVASLRMRGAERPDAETAGAEGAETVDAETADGDGASVQSPRSFPDFEISFDYASERMTPSPAATLRIR